MAISSSMNAGISGLNANGNKLSTIADNIANSETYGYKTAGVEFSSMTINNAGSRTAAGGGRLVSSGGVATTAVWDVGSKGALEGTDNPTDIAVSGVGMLPVTSRAMIGNPDARLMLTTTGSFRTDAQGYMSTPTGLVLLGWPADPDGSIPPKPRDSMEGLEPIRVNLTDVSAVPTTSIELNANLPSTQTAAGSSGDVLPLSLEYFDNLGASQNMSVSFTPSVAAAGDPQTNTWTVEITDGASGVSAGTFEVTFSSAAATAGQVLTVNQTSAGTAPVTTSYDATSGDITLELGDQTIAIGFGSTDPDGPQHLSQLSSTYTPQGVISDGQAAGIYSGLMIDDNGFVSAIYSTGFSQVIYQVPLADVPNTNGLAVLDNQTFGVTANSGAIYLWDAGDGPTGTTEGYARELSTTDIAHELTQLIKTQRAYSSNAKIIQTVDEMLQETTNLKR